MTRAVYIATFDCADRLIILQVTKFSTGITSEETMQKMYTPHAVYASLQSTKKRICLTIWHMQHFTFGMLLATSEELTWHKWFSCSPVHCSIIYASLVPRPIPHPSMLHAKKKSWEWAWRQCCIYLWSNVMSHNCLL